MISDIISIKRTMILKTNLPITGQKDYKGNNISLKTERTDHYENMDRETWTDQIEL